MKKLIKIAAVIAAMAMALSFVACDDDDDDDNNNDDDNTEIVEASGALDATVWVTYNTSTDKITAVSVEGISGKYNSTADGYTGTYTYTIDGVTYTLTISGKLGSYTYTYSTTTTDSDGNSTTYDASGNETSETTTDSDGTTTTTEYDSDGNVTSVTETNSDGTITTTEYEYDSSGNLTSTTVTDSDGNSTMYDASGNVTSYTYVASYSGDGTSALSSVKVTVEDSTISGVTVNGTDVTSTYDSTGTYSYTIGNTVYTIKISGDSTNGYTYSYTSLEDWEKAGYTEIDIGDYELSSSLAQLLTATQLSGAEEVAIVFTTDSENYAEAWFSVCSAASWTYEISMYGVYSASFADTYTLVIDSTGASLSGEKNTGTSVVYKDGTNTVNDTPNTLSTYTSGGIYTAGANCTIDAVYVKYSDEDDD